MSQHGATGTASRHASAPAALLGAAHAGPTVAVTALTALLGVAAGLPAATLAVVTAAVLAGQLTIGWANDLLDAPRDREVGRLDKPIAAGVVSERLVLTCLATAGAVAVVLSLSVGWQSGLVHLLLVVGMGQAYNLGLKATALSWLPYAVAFGALPAVVSLAADPPVWSPWWLLAAGACLGVGAHLLNALPDLADDLRTGVRGLPHRMGATATRVAAAVLLAGASLLAALGPDGAPDAWVWAALVAVGVLATTAALGRGRWPFRAAISVALVDVVLLVAIR